MEDRNALDELVFIKKVIEDSKRTVAENGVGYIVWGILVFVGLLVSYLSNIFDYRFNSFLVWLSLMGFGWLTTLWSVWKKKGKAVKTFGTRLLSAVWLSAGVAMMIIGFVATASGMVRGFAVSPLIAIVLGVAYFLSGQIYGSTWVKVLALGWWIGGIAMLFIVSITQVLVMAFMMLFFQVVPGFIFYFNSKKSVVVE